MSLVITKAGSECKEMIVLLIQRRIFLTIALFSVLPANLYAQTLNIPTRDSTAFTGSQTVSVITNMSLMNRELYIADEILNGNIPEFYRTFIEIKDSAYINNEYRHITYYTLPDYLSIGTDSDYFLCPMTPILGQLIADSTDCILPTRKMVNTIWSNASVKMQPQTIPPSGSMTTVPVFAVHDSIVRIQRQSFMPANPLGELVSGNKKDVVISNLIYSSPPPNRVVIYGWHYPSGSAIQPMYAGHIDSYADYSHGIRLVHNEVFVDGVAMNAADVLASPLLYPLLSDEGQIAVPFYPDTAQLVPDQIPSVPSSWCILAESSESLRLIIAHDPNAHS